VQRTRHDVFADACLAANEHGDIGRRRLLDLVTHRAHPRTVSEEARVPPKFEIDTIVRRDHAPSGKQVQCRRQRKDAVVVRL
jgi:hypothetical protein